MALNSPAVTLVPYTEQDPATAEFVNVLAISSGRDMELQGLHQLRVRNETLDSARSSAVKAAGSMAVNQSHSYIVNIDGRPRGVATAIPGVVPLQPRFGFEFAARSLPRRVLRASHLMEPVFTRLKLVNVAYFVPLTDPAAIDLDTVSTIVRNTTRNAATLTEGHATAWALVAPDREGRQPGGVIGDWASRQEAYQAAGYSVRDIGYYDEREGVQRLSRMAMMTAVV